MLKGNIGLLVKASWADAWGKYRPIGKASWADAYGNYRPIGKSFAG